jgi:DNA-directed RNA polymerase subunit RPC12/RpoP
MEYVTNECPHCGGGIEFPQDGVGDWIECPHCQKRIQLKKPALLARFLRGANPGGTWAIVLASAMVSGTAFFIYFDHRGEAREHDRQQAAAEKVRLDLLSRQNQPKESSASDRAQADQSARTEATLKLLQKDVENLRETNALLVAKLANQQNASTSPQRTSVAPLQTSIAPVQSSRRIRVYEIIDHAPAYVICRTDAGKIVIYGLPLEVGNYLAEVRRLKTEMDEFGSRVEAYDQEARRASAVALTGASGDPAYVQAAMNQRSQANLMLENARDAKANLAKRAS